MDIATTVLLSVILLILTFCFYNWLFASRDYWISRRIPNVPGALPIVGNVLSVFRFHENLSSFCRTVYDTYGDKSMVGFYNLESPTLMVREPELVKTVLQTSFNNFQHNGSMLDLEADPLIGRDPFFIRGQEWRDSRANFTAALSAKRIKTTSLAVLNVCKKLMNHLAEKIKNKDHLDIEVKFLFARYTTEVAAGYVFSIEGNSFVDDYKGTLLDNMKLIMDPTKTKALKHHIQFFWPALNKIIKTRFVPLDVDKFFRGVVKDVIEMRQKGGFAGTDVLQLMLDMEKNGKIHRIEALAQTFSFFLESYETSSLTLSFMAYFIAKHQHVQDRLRTEIETVLARHEGQLTYEGINELNYMEQVMNESMRMFPPVGALTKVCAEAYRLEGSDGLALEVEPGTAIVIPVSGLHMDPTIWENPEDFNPDRFAKGNSDGRHKFAFLPFGEGPRSCPGQRLAIIQVKAAMASIINNYRIELSPKMQDPIRLNPAYFMTTAVGGFWMRLRPL